MKLRIAVLLILATVVAPVLRADDRALLLANRSADPNVLIILDSSGSMNDDFTDNYAFAAWMDDPRSKTQTAKRVLLDVLPTIAHVNFGFTTYHSGQESERSIDPQSAGGSDNGNPAQKHYLYYAGNIKAGGANPWSGTGTDGVRFGQPLQFGGVTPFGDATCTVCTVPLTVPPTTPPTPRKLFSGNFAFNGNGIVYYMGNTTNNASNGGFLGNNLKRLKMTLKKAAAGGSGDYGSGLITVHEVVQTRPNTASQTWTDSATVYDIDYTVATDPADPTWDGGFLVGYDAAGYGASADVTSPSPCSGWQSRLNPLTGVNDNVNKPLIPIHTDAGTGVGGIAGNNIFPLTYVDPASTTRAGVGAFLRRASSIVKFNNYSYTINGALSAMSPALKEITNIAWANSNTPLAASLSSALNYFNTDSQFTAGGDTIHVCRKNYILLITDGLETCNGDPCAVASQFRNAAGGVGIPIYVIGLGGVLGNSLQCIVTNSFPAGNNQQVFNPQDEAGLRDALMSIFDSLSASTRDFSTVAVPSVSTSSEGVAYVSAFNPLNERSIWSGHLRSYVLNQTTGQIPTNAQGLPSTVPFVFGSGSTAPSGAIVWDAGNTDVNIAGIFGNLSAATSGQRVNPTVVLAPATGWSNSPHDQATGIVGRNVFFGLRPGDPGCTSTSYQCLAQLPVGNTGATPPSPPASLPTWWANVRDSQLYANIPTPLPVGPELTRDQALQNSFSFMRGNRDPVVENLTISSLFDATHTTCASLFGHTRGVPPNQQPDSPCYYGDIFGDIFHGNPAVVSFPANTRYFLAQDPSATTFGVYSDRGQSYQTFFTSYRHRRKIMYAASDDGFLHAFDAGVFNADQSSYTSGGQTIQPLLNKYSLGSGREIFGYAPMISVQKFYQLSHTINQDWTVDGAPAVDDVYVDVSRVGSTPQGIVSSNGCGAPPCTDLVGTTPKWRTVLVGIEREGGSPMVTSAGNTSGGGGSVFALDVTDPDLPAHMDATHDGVVGSPECLVTGSPNPFVPGPPPNPSCNAPYPRILWEFTDNAVPTGVAQNGPLTQAEKAGNLEQTTQDLGYTWSRPLLGRIKVRDTVANAKRDFFVAIFGGGYRHMGTNLTDVQPGGDTANFLYMIDIETGRVIYKRNLGVWSSGGSGHTGTLEAAVPAEPAVVDVNSDGYLDYAYIGDTQGRVFKVDLTVLPDFTSGVIASGFWTPTLFFDEYFNNPGGEARQPIFTRPSVFFLGTNASGQPRLGVAFGTGDRDNMPVSTDTNPNFFYAIADDPTVTSTVYKTGAPLNQSLTQASLTTNNCTGANACFNGTGRGFYLQLPTAANGAQIVNSNSLVFNGSIYFNAFLNQGAPANQPCNVTGSAYTYVVDYLTGVSATGIPVAQGAGAQVASDPVVYQGPNGTEIVITLLDNTQIVNLAVPSTPTVKIKSWKEQ
jgi:hypothetical protein